MIRLITVKDNYAHPNPELRAIPVFRDLISRDRGSEGDHDGRKKLKATKELTWIYFMHDPLSPYQILDESERALKVGELVFEDSKYKPDKAVLAAAGKYMEITDNMTSQLLAAARHGCNSIKGYLSSTDLTEEDENGKLKHNINNVIKAIEKIDVLVDNLDKLEERYTKQREKGIEARGGVQINKYNQG